MRLRLTVQRQGLPQTQLLWSTSALGSTSNPPPSSSSLSLSTSTPSGAAAAALTVAQLLDQVNAAVPLESQHWGLEDYVVDVGGFECLHYARVQDVLKEDDVVTIRPLQTQEVRLRALSGRVQVSKDGRHLHDGISWGKPFIRRPPRPEIRMLPRRSALMFSEDGDDDEGDEDEEEKMALLPNQGLVAGRLQSGYHSFGDPYEQAEAEQSQQVLGPRLENHRGSLPSMKRHLDPPFQLQKAFKRVKSEQYPSALRERNRTDRNVSNSSKTVRFNELSGQGALSDDEDDEDDDEDDDWWPSSDESSDLDDADKENYPPGIPPAAPMVDDIAALEETNTPQGFSVDHQDLQREERDWTDFDTNTTNDDSSEDESSDAEASSHKEKISRVPISMVDSKKTISNQDKSDGSTSDSETSTGTDSDEDSDSSDLSDASGTSEASVSNEQGRHSQQRGTTMNAAQVNRKPPGRGSKQTHRRNARRAVSVKLSALKKAGLLPQDATFQDYQNYANRDSHSNSPSAHLSAEFQKRRQTLLDAIQSGGVDANDPSFTEKNATQVDELKTPPASNPMPKNNSITDLNLDYGTPKSQDSPEVESSTVKRRRLDAGASKRLIFGGLGLRVPKNKSDEEQLLNVSRAEARVQTEKLQKSSEVREAEGIVPDEDWQEHVVLNAIECMDPDVEYSCPPFPFAQRWDPQQASDLWRQKNRRASKEQQRKIYGADIEEHFDATMYDEPTVETAEGSSTQIVPEKEGQKALLLDIANKPDLTPEQVIPGARIAFKSLDLSEETDWTPVISDYKVAEVASNVGGTIVLLLDEEYRPAKHFDPETGEQIYSNFRIEAMDLDEDDSLVEITFSELNNPKLLSVGQHVEEDNRNDLNANESATSKQHTQPSIRTPNKVNYSPLRDSSNSKLESIDSDTRRDASLLIRQAGFRSSVDSDVRKPLENTVGTANSSNSHLRDEAIRSDGSDQSDFSGISDSQIDSSKLDKSVQNGIRNGGNRTESTGMNSDNAARILDENPRNEDDEPPAVVQGNLSIEAARGNERDQELPDVVDENDRSDKPPGSLPKSFDALLTPSKSPRRRKVASPARNGEVGRNTRLRSKRASAMANPILLSDDDASQRQTSHAASSPSRLASAEENVRAKLPSTAPATFNSINVIDSLSTGTGAQGSTSSRKVAAKGAIDLTELSDGGSSSDDDDDFAGYEASSSTSRSRRVSLKVQRMSSAGWNSRRKSGDVETNRTRSEV